MTLQQLEYVLALDTYRHYVTAAEKCFVTQPTITTQVKKLEEEIGIQIFNRSKTPLEPTPQGQVIIDKAKSILIEVKQLKEMVNSERESITGEFRIGVIPTISPYLIPPLAGHFSEKYPETTLNIEELKSDRIIDALNKNQLDIGILVTPLNESFLREIPLYNEPFLYYGTKEEVSSIKQITTKQVENKEGLWLLNSGHCFRNQVLNICSPKIKDQSIQFQSGSIETLKRMVDHYGGYTLVPELSINDGDKTNTIRFDNPQPIREVSIVVNKGFAREALINVLRKEILKIVPEEFEKNTRFFQVKWR